MLAATSAWADKILVLQPPIAGLGFNLAPPNLQSVIEGFGQGDTVTIDSTLSATTPALLTTAQDPTNGYDQVWVFGLDGFSGALVTPTQTLVENYLKAGGVVYIQSDVGGMAAEDLAQNIMQDMVSSSIASASINSTVSPVTTAPAYGTTYGGRLRCGSYQSWAFHQTEGAPAGSVVMTDKRTGDAIVVFFDASQLSGGKGRLMVNGDLNLLEQQSGGFGTTPLTATGINVTQFFLNILADRQVPASSCGTVPVNDTQSIAAGKTGTQSVTANDFYDENSTVAATLGTTGNSTVATSGTWPAGITLNTTTGLISVASTAAPGNYPLTYQLCTADLPAECSTAIITLQVDSPTAPAMTLAPSPATLTAGESETVQATVLDGNGNPAVGASVTFTINSGPDGGDTFTATTNSSGVATYTFTGTGAGTDNITAVATLSGGGGTATSTTTVQWQAASLPAVTMAATVPAPTVGQSETVTATVLDGLGNPVDGASVAFTIGSGPDKGKTGTGITNSSGVASFTFTGVAVGTDVITATATVNGNPVSSSFSVIWRAGLPGGASTTGVPTLGETGLALLALLLAGGAALTARRKRA